MSKAKKKHRRRVRPRRVVVAAPPGALEVPEGARPTQIRVMRYDVDTVIEAKDLESLDHDGPRGVTWVDVVGLGSLDVVKRVGERFGMHPLALEDVLHLHQRAKVDRYAAHLFLVTRMIQVHDDGLDLEQVSMLFGEDFVVTFQEREGDSFDAVRRRIREASGRIRKRNAAYLAYALLDALVDGAFPVLEKYGDSLDALEDEIFSDPRPELMAPIHHAKRDLVAMRRASWPMRDMISSLLRDEHPLIDDDLRLYLRDLSDHTLQLVEIVESQRELATSLHDAYLSSVGNRANEVMKVLTMIATLFIPLGFIAGLYGMNFDADVSPFNMPELRWAYGYPAVLGLMATLSAGMLFYFRKKRWF